VSDTARAPRLAIFRIGLQDAIEVGDRAIESAGTQMRASATEERTRIVGAAAHRFVVVADRVVELAALRRDIGTAQRHRRIVGPQPGGKRIVGARALRVAQAMPGQRAMEHRDRIVRLELQHAIEIDHGRFQPARRGVGEAPFTQGIDHGGDGGASRLESLARLVDVTLRSRSLQRADRTIGGAEIASGQAGRGRWRWRPPPSGEQSGFGG